MNNEDDSGEYVETYGDLMVGGEHEIQSQNDLDCGMNPLWYNEEDVAGNSDLIYEEHNIPIYFEEEVVAVENDDEPPNIPSYNEPPKIQQRPLIKTNQTQKSGSHTGSHTPTSANFKPFVLNEHTMRIFKNKIKAIQKRRAQALAREKKQRPKKIKPQPPASTTSVNISKSSTFPQSKKLPASHSSSSIVVTPSIAVKKQPSNFHYKPKPSVDPSKSGEILRMEKVDSDDIEVDILSNSEDDDLDPPNFQSSTFPEIEVDADEEEDEEEGSEEDMKLISNEPVNQDNFLEMEEEDEEDEDDGEESGATSFSSIDEPDANFNEPLLVDGSDEHEETKRKLNELREEDEITYRILENNDLPIQELILDSNEILPIERFMLSEFFTGSSTKSPERYLKIRNHIIGMWQQCRPLYLSKTAARQGLKKCGDVNTIGRIHLTLENLGVINFGCAEVKWILPLKILFGIFQQSIRNKNQSNPLASRSKNNSFSAENYDLSSGGTSSDSMVNRIKSRTQSRTQFELIKCQRYSKENVAPFEISITLSCLLCLYFHALSSKLEIMGFLGGHINKSNGKSKISLKCYKPCRTSISTSISAEMCPVSQVEQSTDITDSGFELLGWFHSHPTFPATPSRTDLKTQNEIQMQFAPNNPFIGFILSCLHMDFKCIYMQKDTAYELHVDIEKEYSDFKKDIESISNFIERDENYEETFQKFINSGNNLLRELSIDNSIENILQDEQEQEQLQQQLV